MKIYNLNRLKRISSKRLSFLVVLFIQITTTVFAQCNSESLKILPTKKYITFDRTINDISILKKVLNLPNSVIQEFGELSTLSGLNNTPTNKTKENNWAIVEDVGIGNIKLSTNNLILSESPVYLTSNNEELSISHLFYVKLNAQSDFELLENLAQQNNIELLGNVKYMPLWYTLSCNKNSSGNALQMTNLFKETRLFTSVQPDYMIKIESSCGSGPLIDPLFLDQWGLENTGQNGATIGIDINLCQAHQITKGSSNVPVAVIDEGFEKTHSDLSNFHSASYDTHTGTFPSQNYGSSHGIQVAGIIGANTNNGIGVTGIAPESPIIQISRHFATTGSPADIQRLANGIGYAWINGAAVINNSWKITGLSSACMLLINDAFSDAMTQGRNGLGTVVVFASANDNSSVSYPANFHPDVIVVGAMSPCGERWSPASCLTSTIYGSNYGPELDVVAPGVLIPTTAVGNSYNGNFWMTSSAAPHVTGVAALILSVNPLLTQKQVGDIIEKTAQKVRPMDYDYEYTTGRENGTWNIEMGYGLVDAYQAVLLAQDYALCPTNNLTITDDVDYPHNDVRMAGQTLIANNNVASGATALYTANDYVLLDTDFSAEAGSHFSAFIQDCAVVSAGSTLQQDYLSKKLDDEDFIIVENNIDDLKVYPNPSSGSISLRLDSGIDFIKIYDFSGKVIFTQSKKNQKELNINIKEKGLYMVEVNSKDKMVFKKVVIQ